MVVHLALELELIRFQIISQIVLSAGAGVSG